MIYDERRRVGEYSMAKLVTEKIGPDSYVPQVTASGSKANLAIL